MAGRRGPGEFTRGGESKRVEPKVLVYLAQHAGQVVGCDELLAAACQGVVVGDDALTRAIFELRKGLGDNARRPVYIERCLSAATG